MYTWRQVIRREGSYNLIKRWIMCALCVTHLSERYVYKPPQHADRLVVEMRDFCSTVRGQNLNEL